MEARFPAVESNSKKYYDIILIFVADSVQPIATPVAPSVKIPVQRAQASNFRFTLGSLDTTRISRIEPFTITRAVNASEGAYRIPSAQPEPNHISQVVVVTPQAGAASWTAWRDDFLVNGNNSDEKELEGSLTLFKADLQTPLLTLQLSHVGIQRLAPDASTTAATGQLAATLYCEQITFTAPSVKPAPLPPSTPTPSPVPAITSPVAATPATKNPDDSGLRDPAGFPRPDGLTRTAYAKTDLDYRLSETANYKSDQEVAVLLEHYSKVLGADGWKRQSLNESGSSAADAMILSYWRKDNVEADLRLYAAKPGSTVSVSLTTSK